MIPLMEKLQALVEEDRIKIRWLIRGRWRQRQRSDGREIENRPHVIDQNALEIISPPV